MAPSSKMDIHLYELETLLFVMRYPGFEEYGVSAILREEQRSVTEDLERCKKLLNSSD